MFATVLSNNKINDEDYQQDVYNIRILWHDDNEITMSSPRWLAENAEIVTEPEEPNIDENDNEC